MNTLQILRSIKKNVRMVAHVGSRMSQMYSVLSPETPILLTNQ